MTVSMRRSTDSAYAAIDRLARQRSTCEDFQWAAVSDLRRIVGFDSMCWNLIDPLTWVPSWTVADNPVIGRQQRRVHEAWASSGEFAELTDRGFAFTRVDAEGAPRRESYWWEIAEPGGLRDGLSVALAADGVCWGMLHLYRDGGRPFTAADVEALMKIASTLGRRLRRSTIDPAGAPSSDDEAGTVILDRALGLVASTPAADRWLSRLPQAVPGGDALPGFIYAVAARATPGGSSLPSPRLRIRADDGTWLVLDIASLSESAPLGVGAMVMTIEPARRTDLRPLLMRAHQLSDREREVAALVTNGLTNLELADALFITRHTVSDHLKAIYSKLGVNSRSELSAVLAGNRG
ncbi:hypothetical protein BS329_20795 [Amycolatopsis coloradensis]|uniref:HTH luxR-type domain-containing protein n=2 Tax=Amycolatopsis coloradensis TaxID=76021 RepID=A0A1R0KQU6_9PSEU|nr:hypothetical protein BS329_20795 [Amycolatopsis coloradensis]